MVTPQPYSIDWVRPSYQFRAGLNPTQAPGCNPEQLARIPTLTDEEAAALSNWTTAPLEIQLKIEKIKRDILVQKLKNMESMKYNRNVYQQEQSQRRRQKRSKELMDNYRL